ncbi:MAG: Unknown protein [uncultured Sulfurovum sp.]|uniref:Lipoprotein n=1 Tax=uncultured Sulfurovum sp. TaxID=269237 RepID=A0A6S6S3D6_9BACT|nr:MAG: Unknown protein [uncultured Sulfurovum sp.]
MIQRNIYLLIVGLFLTSCSAHFESTTEEQKMDYIFEKELVKELNKIRRVKGLSEIQMQRSVLNYGNKSPFDAQMRRAY